MKQVVVAAVAFALVGGHSPAIAQATDMQVESFSVKQVEIWNRVADRFWKSGDGPRFFTAAGPFKGCDAYKSAISEIAEAHYPAFRPKIIAAYREVVPAGLLQQRPHNSWAPHMMAYQSRIRSRLDDQTSTIIGQANSELTVRLNAWLRRERLQNSALGVNRRGQTFWYANPAAWRLICAQPTENDRRRALGVWLDGAK